MVVVEFECILKIQEELKNNSVIDLSYLRQSDIYKLEYFNVSFSRLIDLIDWVETSGDVIDKFKILISVEYMLEEDYFIQRFKGKYDQVYFVKRKDDAIICTSKVINSVVISCKSYSEFEKGITACVFE